MQRKKLQKLQKHILTLKLFKIKKGGGFSLQKSEKTRFSIFYWEFDCGMPACVGGHAKHIFKWGKVRMMHQKFGNFFDLNYEERNWIVDNDSYKSLDPTPKTAAKHIQDVLDGKI